MLLSNTIYNNTDNADNPDNPDNADNPDNTDKDNNILNKNQPLIYLDTSSDYNIYFNDQINDNTCLKLASLINSYQNNIYKSGITDQHINLYIQSQGGSLLPTLAIVDEIKNSKVPIWTHIRGYAASAATLISVAGAKRLMYNHSLMMIHNVRTETTVEDYRTVEDIYNTMTLFSRTIRNIYLDNSNLSREQLDKLLEHDSWLNSSTALEYGLVDIVY
tara:strand:- start:293 stop:946 length:654 start_codon:yes stop_codon:yes gene_type:complete